MRRPASLSRVKRSRCCLPLNFPHASTLHITCLVNEIDLVVPENPDSFKIDIKMTQNIFYLTLKQHEKSATLIVD